MIPYERRKRQELRGYKFNREIPLGNYFNGQSHSLREIDKQIESATSSSDWTVKRKSSGNRNSTENRQETDQPSQSVLYRVRKTNTAQGKR